MISQPTHGDLRVDLTFGQANFAADEAVDATVTITNTSKHQVSY